MEISIIPQWLIKYLSSDFYRQNDYNIIISNLLVLLLFVFLGNSMMSILSHIPHYCLIDKTFGIECPVCGTTRAFCELSNGNISKAFHLNRTSLLVASFFLIQIPMRIFSVLGITNSIKINIISKHISQVILTLILLNWIINLFINI